MTLKENEILSYEDVKIDDKEKAILNAFVKKNPDIWKKMHIITRVVMWEKVLNGDMTPEQWQGAVAYSKYIKGYFGS